MNSVLSAVNFEVPVPVCVLFFADIIYYKKRKNYIIYSVGRPSIFWVKNVFFGGVNFGLNTFLLKEYKNWVLPIQPCRNYTLKWSIKNFLEKKKIYIYQNSLSYAKKN